MAEVSASVPAAVLPVPTMPSARALAARSAMHSLGGAWCQLSLVIASARHPGRVRARAPGARAHQGLMMLAIRSWSR